ncbi:hypothetical protein BJF83_08975 [Nocardiopsis sp. CNR-923]|nr:hypothetical protein BJF83_08975 [Nocardiopsis sp. CNR-923]
MHERVDGAAQVRQGDALVHDQALQLVEDRAVRGVELVGAEGLAGRDHVDRELAVEQGAHLHRRGVRAHDQPGLAALGAAHEEGVLHGAGRVVGQEVEGVEVEPLRLDLGPLGDLEPHADEDVGHPLGDGGQRVPRTARGAVPGQGDVDPLLDEDALVALDLQDGLAGLEGLAHVAAGPAHALARVGLGGRGQRADLPVGQRQRGAVRGVREPDLLEFVEVSGCLDGGQSLLTHTGDLVGVQGGHLDGVEGIVRCRHGWLPRRRTP